MIDRLLCSVVLAVLPVLAGEYDGRVFGRSVALSDEAVIPLLHPHVHPHLHQPVPSCAEIKAASSVRHRGTYGR